VVEGVRSPVTYQIDKKVVDVSQMATVVSGNAADVLENIPSVTVDIEGNVSLRGSGSFTVLLDGRPSIIDAQDILQQIPASSIDKIEIITNPSAKYDPEGTAGIINILMKKNQNLGLSGVINANAGLDDKYGGDFIFEYKTPSIKYNFGLDYNRRFMPGTSHEERRLTFQNVATYQNSDGTMQWGRISYGFRGGLEFSLGDNDILGFNGRVGDHSRERNRTANYTSWNDTNSVRSYYNSFSDGGHGGNNYSINAGYLHKFDTDGHQLTADFTYGGHNNDESSTSGDFTNGVQFGGKKTSTTGPETEIEGKLDYTLPLGENRKFEAGMEGQNETSVEDNKLYSYDAATNDYLFQSLYSYKIDSKNTEFALYSIYGDEWGNFGFQGGVRTEYTYRDITLVQLNQNFHIDRWDVFPSAHFSYKFSALTQLMASYTRRIKRPRGWELEPYLTWMDANNVRRGNAGLLPEFIDAVETGFQTFIGKVNLSSDFYYKVTSNKIERVRSVYAKNITLNSTENVGKDYSLGAEFMMMADPLEFWTINLMGNVYNYKVEGMLNNQDFSRSSFNWSTRLTNMFNISKATQFQVNFMYNSPTVSSQGTETGYNSVDVAVKQDLFNRFLTLTLQVRDIFSSAKHEFTSEGQDFYTYNFFNRESPMVMLNLRINLNNYKDKSKKGMNGDEGGGFEEF
ncbi:MAG: TonB-dependent receptor, partial [Ignavibacteriaceae bacterium]|nr:TonB-dependent receptor [Ignavibacteriaceae bacterium]